MTSLCLIRHGQTSWNAEGRIQGQEDIPLSPSGVEQVFDLSHELSSKKFGMIYTSPLSRALETAIILAPLYKYIPSDDRLAERHYGLWQGMLEFDVKEKYPNIWNSNWRLNGPPNGESQSSLVIRAASFLDDILKKHDGQSVAIVSHECLLSAMLGYILKIPLEMHCALRWKNCGYVWVGYVNGQPRLIFQ